MSIVLSGTEREDLRRRYLLAGAEHGIEILGPTLTVENNGGPPKTYTWDEDVIFTRGSPRDPRSMTSDNGTVALFVRMNDVVIGWATFAIIMADSPHGQRRQFRIPVHHLQKLESRGPLP